MTWYFTDKQEYVENLKGIGQAYREVIGKHFPAMAAVQVVALVEDRAKIEIQAQAVIPEA
jgi:enamine deaminase RidA (YjgF/YER057c/UK114 family)